VQALLIRLGASNKVDFGLVVSEESERSERPLDDCEDFAFRAFAAQLLFLSLPITLAGSQVPRVARES
jgi:hypothetical protein